METQTQQGNYPARTEEFHQICVTFHEIDGKEYLTGEDIGRCLGLEQPRKSVNKIFNRNREELEPHQGVANLGTPGGKQDVICFSETGANLIAMLAHTKPAKEFRLWLARLPRRVREAAPEAARLLLAEGVRKGFCIASDLLSGRVDPDALARLFWWRRSQATQKETAILLGISREQVQQLEKRLKELGIEFAEIRDGRRIKRMKEAFADEVARAGRHPAERFLEARHDAPAS